MPSRHDNTRAKSVKLFPGLLNCRATFVEPSRKDREAPVVQISLPDGKEVRSDSSNADGVLSAYFRRNVSLRRTAPEDFTFDQNHPDVEGADPGGNRDAVVPAKFGSALFASLGMESPVSIGSFFDVFPMPVLTSSTLARLSELQPQTRFDLRRFRMNVIPSTERPGFVENDWVGHTLGRGDQARLIVALLASRCVMTTLAQDDLPQVTDVIRTLVRHNRVQIGELGQYRCAGVYAVVDAPGTVRTGDRVMLN